MPTTQARLTIRLNEPNRKRYAIGVKPKAHLATEQATEKTRVRAADLVGHASTGASTASSIC